LQAGDEHGVVQGFFIPETSSDGVKALSCAAVNDTVTHSNREVKQSVDVVWNALDRCSFSDVYFR